MNPKRNSVILVGVFMLTFGKVQAYEIVSVENGGTIQGAVRYNGVVDTTMIVPTKDISVCGSPREEPLIRVDGDKGVASAVVYLMGVESGKDWPNAGETPELNQENCRFEPQVQAVPPGTLNIVNSDPVLHNTHGYYGRRTAFNLALPNEGQTIPTELRRPGTVRVDCDAHGWMEGWIYVVDNPYYAVTGADGSFNIENVPPGDYTLVAVQPFTGPVEMPVTVTGGEATTMDVELVEP